VISGSRAGRGVGVPTQKRSRRKELRKIVRTWVDLFNRHDLLTYASAIGLQAFVAWVALALLGLGVLAASGQQSIWYTQIAP
jgi:hypothetical protein